MLTAANEMTLPAIPAPAAVYSARRPAGRSLLPSDAIYSRENIIG